MFPFLNHENCHEIFHRNPHFVMKFYGLKYAHRKFYVDVDWFQAMQIVGNEVLMIKWSNTLSHLTWIVSLLNISRFKINHLNLRVHFKSNYLHSLKASYSLLKSCWESNIRKSPHFRKMNQLSGELFWIEIWKQSKILFRSDIWLYLMS